MGVNVSVHVYLLRVRPVINWLLVQSVPRLCPTTAGKVCGLLPPDCRVSGGEKRWMDGFSSVKMRLRSRPEAWLQESQSSRSVTDKSEQFLGHFPVCFATTEFNQPYPFTTNICALLRCVEQTDPLYIWFGPMYATMCGTKPILTCWFKMHRVERPCMCAQYTARLSLCKCLKLHSGGREGEKKQMGWWGVGEGCSSGFKHSAIVSETLWKSTRMEHECSQRIQYI